MAAAARSKPLCGHRCSPDTPEKARGNRRRESAPRLVGPGGHGSGHVEAQAGAQSGPKVGRGDRVVGVGLQVERGTGDGGSEAIPAVENKASSRPEVGHGDGVVGVGPRVECAVQRARGGSSDGALRAGCHAGRQGAAVHAAPAPHRPVDMIAAPPRTCPAHGGEGLRSRRSANVQEFVLAGTAAPPRAWRLSAIAAAESSCQDPWLASSSSRCLGWPPAPSPALPASWRGCCGLPRRAACAAPRRPAQERCAARGHVGGET